MRLSYWPAMGRERRSGRNGLGIRSWPGWPRQAARSLECETSRGRPGSRRYGLSRSSRPEPVRAAGPRSARLSAGLPRRGGSAKAAGLALRPGWPDEQGWPEPGRLAWGGRLALSLGAGLGWAAGFEPGRRLGVGGWPERGRWLGVGGWPEAARWLRRSASCPVVTGSADGTGPGETPFPPLWF